MAKKKKKAATAVPAHNVDDLDELLADPGETACQPTPTSGARSPDPTNPPTTPPSAAIAKAIAAELRRHKADEAMVQEAEEIARRGEQNARRDEQERKRQAALNEEKAKQKRARNTQVTPPPPTTFTSHAHGCCCWHHEPSSSLSTRSHLRLTWACPNNVATPDDAAHPGREELRG